jgi:type I restriction enzyme S subunit
MSFPRYPEYKDSGVEWLGEVPKHWIAAPIKHFGRLKGGAGFPHDQQGVEGEELSFHKVNALGSASPEGMLLPSENTISNEVAKKLGAFVFPAGAIVFAKVGAALLLARIRELAEPACIDNNMMGLVVEDESISNKFLRYAMALVRFDLISNPGAVPSLNEGQIGNFKIAKPPHIEQVAIADFLDHETAKIDTLIAEQEQLITLLKEKRQAVISHAVTKGLDPNVKMKHSGIEWQGNVPGHWDNVALKRISPSLTVGIVVNPSNYVAEDGLPFIYGGDIREGQITFETARRISQEDSLRNEKTRLMAGDLLTVRVGYPGITAVVPPECEGGNCASVMHVRRGNFDSRWLCYVMNSRIVRFQVEVVQYGAAQEQFNISHAVEFRVPRPPANEQREIADFLDHQSAQFDELVAEALQGISLLKERRSALISAAVTGKIDVRKIA